MLIFGSLFTGIGGFDLGFESAGMQCSWQVEIDDYCQKVLEKHWPNVARYKDVRECGRRNLSAVELIVGGFPCQPHSLAGKRRGAEDDRDLWPEYRRIIAELRPRWVVGENVPGIRTTILDAVLSDLEGLDYTTGTLIVPACAFDAPHRRERVFVVAHAGRERVYEYRKPGSTIEESRKQDRILPNGIQGVRIEEEKVLADARGNSLAQFWEQSKGQGERRDGGRIQADDSRKFWTTEPGVGRVANGVPNRVDRLRALGNAVVPQVAEWLGRMIVEVDNAFMQSRA